VSDGTAQHSLDRHTWLLLGLGSKGESKEGAPTHRDPWALGTTSQKVKTMDGSPLVERPDSSLRHTCVCETMGTCIHPSIDLAHSLESCPC
jgi:hypothetical protein